MQHVNVSALFTGLRFTKPGSKIVESALAKIEKLNDKIKKRRERITELRAAHHITDAEMIELLQLALKDAGRASFYSLSASNSRVGRANDGRGNVDSVERIIPGGVVLNLTAEQEAIEAETEQVDRLELIMRNLDQSVGSQHGLSFADMVFLGF